MPGVTAYESSGDTSKKKLVEVGELLSQKGTSSKTNRIVLRNRLRGLVVRVPGYRPRGPGCDSRRYQIF
jgi:hypothetical protein